MKMTTQTQRVGTGGAYSKKTECTVLCLWQESSPVSVDLSAAE